MKRPLPVILIGLLFIASGAIGILYHGPELRDINTEPDVVLVLVLRLLAIIGGVYTLRGVNWARWLLLAWILYHVGLSIFHSTAELVMHIGVTVAVIVALFNPKANLFFRK